MPMVDRFITYDDQVVNDACEALRSGDDFWTTVIRPECAEEYREQHWRGPVCKITKLGKGFEIEVYREDI